MQGPPTTARGAATYERILAAATEEFAAHGIAGARTDRIITAAQANKAQMYAYFGSKDELFDVVFETALRRFTGDVAIVDGDLGNWAAHLYDAYLDKPHVVRLVTWARLERHPHGPLTITPADREPVDDPKIRAIRDGQSTGVVRPDDPAMVMSMVIAMSMAWSPVSNVYAAYAGEPQATHARRKEMLSRWVRAASRNEGP